jgi:hypothetical protein
MMYSSKNLKTNPQQLRPHLLEQMEKHQRRKKMNLRRKPGLCSSM